MQSIKSLEDYKFFPQLFNEFIININFSVAPRVLSIIIYLMNVANCVYFPILSDKTIIIWANNPKGIAWDFLDI